jgi:signal transduction histidine kinase
VNPPPYLDLYAEVATTGIEKSFDAFFAPLGRHFRISVFSPGPGRFATIFEDITERKTAEQERESLLADLARANAELESLIYVASHDLRAPLVNLQGFGQRLEKSCCELTELLRAPAIPAAWHEPVARLLGERIPGALKYIRSSIAKMEALINGLLRVARLGHATLTVERLDMDRLVGEVLTAQGYQIQTVDARVQVAPLPPCLGDAALINQVFANLLDNALKYRAPERLLQITISGRLEQGLAIYEVADNGMGIAPQHQSRIWEMFHRLHPESSIAGEGLGLNLVRRILDRHRGRVWVESVPGQGSRFYVSLPAG